MSELRHSSLTAVHQQSYGNLVHSQEYVGYIQLIKIKLFITI